MIYRMVNILPTKIEALKLPCSWSNLNQWSKETMKSQKPEHLTVKIVAEIWNYEKSIKNWFEILINLTYQGYSSKRIQVTHCLKSVQIRSYFCSVFSCIQTEYGEVLSPNAGKYGREITLYLDTFHIVTFFKHYRHCSPLWNLSGVKAQF